MLKFTILLVFAAAACVAADEELTVKGGLKDVEETEWPEIQQKLVEAVTQLEAENQAKGAEVKRLISARKQTVSGTKYHVVVEIKTIEGITNCTSEIWEKPWEHFRQTKIICEGEPRVVERHDVGIEMRVLGGFSDVSPSNYPQIEKHVTESLVQLGTQNHAPKFQFVRIKSAQSQVVAGTNYRINAEFTLDSVPKDCWLNLFVQPWTGIRETEFECDGHPKYTVKKEGTA